MNCFSAGEIIELDDLLPVGRVGELQAEHLGIFLGLLQAIAGGFPGRLGFEDGQREIALVTQEVIHAAGRLADKALAHRHDAAVRDGALLGDGMRLAVPACGLQPGHNELSAGVGFGQRHGFTLVVPNNKVNVILCYC